MLILRNIWGFTLVRLTVYIILILAVVGAVTYFVSTPPGGDITPPPQQNFTLPGSLSCGTGTELNAAGNACAPIKTTPPPVVGAVTTPDSTDLCKDIPGLQTAADIVANKLVRQNDGTCVPSSTLATTTPPVLADQCLDIPGLQTVVPDKMRRDAAGNCAVPPPEGSKGTSFDWNSLISWITPEMIRVGLFFLAAVVVCLFIGGIIRAAWRFATLPPPPPPPAGALATPRVWNGFFTWAIIILLVALFLIFGLPILQTIPGFQTWFASIISGQWALLWLAIALIILVATFWAPGLFRIIPLVAGVALLFFFLPRAIDYGTEKGWFTAGTSGFSTASVAGGCNNVTLIIPVSRYQPGRPGCRSNWSIADSSPANCIDVVLFDGTVCTVCKGGESAVDGVPLRGWQPNNGQPAALSVMFVPDH